MNEGIIEYDEIWFYFNDGHWMGVYYDWFYVIIIWVMIWDENRLGDILIRIDFAFYCDMMRVNYCH